MPDMGESVKIADVARWLPAPEHVAEMDVQVGAGGVLDHDRREALGDPL